MSFRDLVAAADRVVMRELGEDDDADAPEAIVYLPEGCAPVNVTGVFDENYVLAKSDDEAGVETIGPAVFFRLEDLPVDPREDEPTIAIRNIDYLAIERRPDGMGGIVIALRRKT
jgi:hypothetical protein